MVPASQRQKTRERGFCWNPGLRDPRGLPAPGNSVCLRGDLERLTQLELGQVWVMGPAPSRGFNIFPGLIQHVPCPQQRVPSWVLITFITV